MLGGFLVLVLMIWLPVLGAFCVKWFVWDSPLIGAALFTFSAWKFLSIAAANYSAGRMDMLGTIIAIGAISAVLAAVSWVKLAST